MTVDPADVLAVVEAAYRQHFEVTPARASVSFLGVEAIEVLRFDESAESDAATRHYLSLGMSKYPMTDPSAVTVDEKSAPRAELMLTTQGKTDEVWRRLAVLAAAPAVEGAVFAAGNTVDLGEPLCAGSRCTGAVLAASTLQPITVSGVADVHVIELLPATNTELAWARVHGSGQLRELWTARGVNLWNLMRESVPLD